MLDGTSAGVEGEDPLTVVLVAGAGVDRRPLEPQAASTPTLTNPSAIARIFHTRSVYPL